MKTIFLLTALTVTCSEWNGIKTCHGPNGYHSTESTWNNVTTGQDNNSTWRVFHWNNQDTIQVTPKR
jgi:hypothetical protein